MEYRVGQALVQASFEKTIQKPFDCGYEHSYQLKDSKGENPPDWVSLQDQKINVVTKLNTDVGEHELWINTIVKDENSTTFAESIKLEVEILSREVVKPTFRSSPPTGIVMVVGETVEIILPDIKYYTLEEEGKKQEK